MSMKLPPAAANRSSMAWDWSWDATGSPQTSAPASALVEKVIVPMHSSDTAGAR